MGFVVADQSKVQLCRQQLTRAPFPGATIGLFIVDLTLTHSTTYNQVVTHELSIAGYARQALVNWSVPTLTEDYHALSFSATVEFLNSGSTISPLIFGWFFADQAHSLLIASGKFAPPKLIFAGKSYRTTPFWLLTGDPG